MILFFKLDSGILPLLVDRMVLFFRLSLTKQLQNLAINKPNLKKGPNERSESEISCIQTLYLGDRVPTWVKQFYNLHTYVSDDSFMI